MSEHSSFQEGEHAGAPCGDEKPSRRLTTPERAKTTDGTSAFVRYHQRYDDWYERHRAAYLSELLAVRALLPWNGRGLEIGVGTGRFASPLGVAFGIDPAAEMLAYSRARGVCVLRALAEALPFADAVFDHVLIVTTICFVDNARAMLREAARVLLPGGVLVIGLIDRESRLGQDYVAHRAESLFYREAKFFSAAEVETLLTDTGFGDLTWVQTLSAPLSELHEIEPISAGTGRGAFVAVRARVKGTALAP
jgi:SAM-dependent methyltransferase